MYVRSYVSQFPLAGRRSATVRAANVIFSHHLGSVHPFSVLKLQTGATSVAPVARHSRRHRFNMAACRWQHSVSTMLLQVAAQSLYIKLRIAQCWPLVYVENETNICLN